MTQNKERYVLDNHKLLYHMDRVKNWLDGERIAPIMIDWALTQRCPYNCLFCYSKAAQKNPIEEKIITRKAAFDFIDDCKEIGVKATTLTSDGESTLMPYYYDLVHHGKEIGIDMATATCGFTLKENKLPQLLEDLTYLRFNISAGEPKRYSDIHGVPEAYFYKVKKTIEKCVKLKEENGFKVTLGLQMVLLPEFGDQIVPLARYGKEIGADYLVIKHCSDSETKCLGIDYDNYKPLYPLMEEAESYSTKDYFVKAKWSKFRTGRNRRYIHCYAPPLMLQISGTGILAPCGPLFGHQYKKYHIGNIVDTRFRDMFRSDRYWKVMDMISKLPFDARKDCACLCFQDKANEFLWDLKQGKIKLEDCIRPKGKTPDHINFV